MIELNTILVVDDDPIVHAIVEPYFRERGATMVLAAMDGAEAIRLMGVHGSGIDLILCDLNMPKVDGLQFLRHLMEVRFTNPVIIISGENEDILRTARTLAAAHKLNIAGTIGKPLRPRALTPILETAHSGLSQQSRAESPDVGYRDLHSALRLGEIEAHFQPKVDLATGRLGGAEALARWRHPDLGMIPPNVFVPIAEKHRLVLPLTHVILDQSLAMVRRSRDVHGAHVSVAVNTNAESVSELRFPSDMRTKVEAAQVPPSQITFEITERSLLEDTSISIEVLTRLRMMGFNLSIDDFGTGKSNLEQLRNFPFTELKIDRSFVRDADRDAVTAVCLQSMVRLGKDLGLKIVAEGVETDSELALCRTMPIDLLQGFLFARPMAPDDFLAYVGEDSRRIDGLHALAG